MADPREQPDYEQVIQEFIAWVKRSYCYEVIDPNPKYPVLNEFVAVDSIRQYFEEESQRKLKKITRALFPNNQRVWPEDILTGKIGIFCTLLNIHKGPWIEHFRHHDALSDSSLPFDPKRLPPDWPEDTGDPEFLQRFCEEQWKFCVPIMRSPFVDKRFQKNRVLPIVFRKTLNTGASAALWQIKLHPSYNQLIPEAAKSKLGEDANTFVLKTYFTADAETYYNTEVAAFRRLGRNPSIIGFHGSFTRGDTYNVLLEYADKGTLEDYFKTELPPIDGEEIIQFWEALFKVIDALTRIHNVKSDESDGPRVFHGWHQDVKPQNILVVSSGSGNTRDWQFKLADLGISHFNPRNVGSSRQNSTASDAYGTQTYGAPECCRPDMSFDRLSVGQNVDIWSLGCIYSEAARWIKNQYRGIMQYRQERRDETRSTANFGEADCFHNGVQILEAVQESHRQSKRNLREEDFITKAVIEQMIGAMLDTAAGRPTAINLLHTSRRIVNDARKELEATLNASSSPGRGVVPNRRITYPEPRPPPPPNPPPSPFTRTRSPLPAMPETPETNSFNEFRKPNRIVATTLLDKEDGKQSTSPDTMTEEDEGEEHSPPPRDFQVAAFVERGGRDSTDQYLGEPSGRDIPTQHKVTRVAPQGDSVAPFGPRKIEMNQRNGTHAPGNINKNSFNHQSHRSVPDHTSVNPPWAPLGSNSPDAGQRMSSQANNYSRESPHRQSSHWRGNSDSSASSPASPTSIDQRSPPQSPPFTERQQPRQRRSQNIVIQDKICAPATATPPPAHWSIQEALKWKRDHKNTRKLIPNSELRDRLKDRDHVFLIDDSLEMAPHWEAVIDVLEALSYILKTVDPNGLDLSFTVSSDSLEDCKKTSRLVDMTKTRRLKGTTDMNLKLTSLLDEYQNALTKGRSNSIFRRAVRPMNLYILTDGVWEKDCDVEAPIRSLVQKLVELGKGRIQVGIQFISFGNNTSALTRMDHLDSGLGLKPDIVDHERSDGNVWKMLLGSTNDTFDKVNENRQSITSSSTIMDKEYEFTTS